ncbi:uncharacterized protein BDZ99DRAFT_475341 [Mytilinidion resinicola]|uniref:Uncharacterized protein n=1 Tax=Mytilinidion resinicola TaxID=574789 RepID=A0A6A6YTE1_9PEZI|nr:uncharacterized protein BDZ99DRAFT_475341 [Mytilinidion resinicola]KAF2811838.1 hypothetical protein BDZ99DRAFT_475341 [Mytilinidion resinicola]
MGGSSRSPAVRNGRTGRFQQSPGKIKRPDLGGDKMGVGACGNAISMDISPHNTPLEESDQQARGTRPGLLSDADTGYAGEDVPKAAESPDVSAILQTHDPGINMAQNNVVVGSSLAPSPRGGDPEVHSLFKTTSLPAIVNDEGPSSSMQTLDMQPLISSPYQAGLRNRLSNQSLGSSINYGTKGLTNQRLSLDEVRIANRNKRGGIPISENGQVTAALLRKQVEAFAATQPAVHRNEGEVRNNRDVQPLESGPISDSGLQVATSMPAPATIGPTSGTTTGTACATDTDESSDSKDEGCFTNYSEEDSFTWIETHHYNISRALVSGDPITNFPMISKHKLALWNMNHTPTHKPGCRFGRILLPAPPSPPPKSGFTMRKALRDSDPEQSEIDDAVWDYFDAMTREDKLGMIDEVNLLLTALRWSMSLVDLSQTIMRRFTVFAVNRRPDFVETHKWFLLHTWLERQHGSTAQQIWEKPNIEAGWDVLVPAGIPSWGGTDLPSCERTLRSFSPHPADEVPNVAWGRTKGFKSDLRRDQI